MRIGSRVDDLNQVIDLIIDLNCDLNQMIFFLFAKITIIIIIF